MNVTVGVSGGIAAYKAAELVRALQQQALDVHVVMTEAATQFIQPLTFASITGHKVITSLWVPPESPDDNLDSAIEHIEAAQTTDALVVAPATASILAKFAHGIADDFLTTLYLATTAPVVVAPAMNVNMWQHPATQANLDTLVGRNVHNVPPDSGYLACCITATISPLKRCSSPPEAHAKPSTRCAFSATAPAARWDTLSPKPPSAEARESFSSPRPPRCVRPPTSRSSRFLLRRKCDPPFSAAWTRPPSSSRPPLSPTTARSNRPSRR